MKKIIYLFASLCILSNHASANITATNLSQDQKTVSATLNEGDVLSVQYNLERRPVWRNSEWWYYALRCTTSDSSTLSYTLHDAEKSTSLPALFSNDGDQQIVGLNMDERGVFKIKNNSHEKIYVNCTLYNKFGM